MSKRTKRPSAEAAMRQEALGAVAKAAATPRAGKEDGAGSAEPMPPETGDPGADRIRRIFRLLKNSGSKEGRDAFIKDLAAGEDERLMEVAVAYGKIEKARQEKTEQLKQRLASFQIDLNTTLQESQGEKNLEEAVRAQRLIKSMFWDDLVRCMNGELRKAKERLSEELEQATEELKEQFRSSLSMPPPTRSFRQRILAERWLLSGTLAIGIIAGGGLISVEGIGEAIATAGRTALGWGPWLWPGPWFN